ncbi:MAG TPA: LytTR family DNA-binding domain-containing protein [Thermoanaerobaculia bacterium]
MAGARVTLRTLIVDDEPLARESIRVLLERDPEIEIVGECSGVDAAALIARKRPHIMFLDVQMPEVDGFDLLGRIGEQAVPAVVFVTAYDEFAIRAFEVEALDYLLKPFDDARFARTLERAKQRALSPPPKSQDYRQRFLVRVRERVVVVNASDIDWIEAADYYVTMHAGGRTYLLREPLADLEKVLDPAVFFRVHRSAIVNLGRIREIHPMFHGDSVLVLTDGSQVKLSRSRREEFERVFG